MAHAQSTPERIMQIASGGWASAVLGTACAHKLFNHLEQPDTAASIARKSGLSPRGTQALLDGLHGLGFLSLSNGNYQNAPDASFFLVEGKPAYMAGLPQIMTEDLAHWPQLVEAA